MAPEIRKRLVNEQRGFVVKAGKSRRATSAIVKWPSPDS